MHRLGGSDRPLQRLGEVNAPDLDHMRNLSGLTEARGNRSVYVDCPFARAWWRQRLVTRVLRHRDPVPYRSVGYVVRLNKGYWERLTTLKVSRNSVFGSDVVQALVATVARFLESEPESPLRTQQQLGAAVRRISAVTAGRELGVLDFAELVDLTSELLVEQHHVSLAQATSGLPTDQKPCSLVCWPATQPIRPLPVSRAVPGAAAPASASRQFPVGDRGRPGATRRPPGWKAYNRLY